jgi:hypothetical protein
MKTVVPFFAKTSRTQAESDFDP